MARVASRHSARVQLRWPRFYSVFNPQRCVECLTNLSQPSGHMAEAILPPRNQKALCQLGTLALLYKAAAVLTSVETPPESRGAEL